MIVAVHYIIPGESLFVYCSLVKDLAKPLDTIQQHVPLLHNRVISCALSGGAIGFNDPVNTIHNAIQSARGNEMDEFTLELAQSRHTMQETNALTHRSSPQ
jgi:hypothetical protein